MTSNSTLFSIKALKLSLKVFDGHKARSKMSFKSSFFGIILTYSDGFLADIFLFSEVRNISRLSGTLPPVKPFNFDDNSWDLRAINPKGQIKRSQYIVNFDSLFLDWFIILAKQYIYYLCKSQK